MNLSIIPYYFEVGDYWYFIVDFPVDIFIGEGFIPIIKVEIYHLTLSQPNIVKNYLLKSINDF